MAGVTIKLAGMPYVAGDVINPRDGACGLLKWKINPAWVVLGGGLGGMLVAAFR
jgi:hypothetical protein